MLDLVHFDPSKVLLSTTLFPMATCVAVGGGSPAGGGVPSPTITGGSGPVPTGSGGVYPTLSSAPWQNGTCYTAPPLLPTAATRRRRLL